MNQATYLIMRTARRKMLFLLLSMMISCRTSEIHTAASRPHQECGAMATDCTRNSRRKNLSDPISLGRFLECERIRRAPTVHRLRGGGPTLEEITAEPENPLDELFCLDKKFAAGEYDDHDTPEPSDDPVDEANQGNWQPKTSGPYANLPDIETEAAWRLGDLYLAREGGKRC
jgi:hypothetical protein